MSAEEQVVEEDSLDGVERELLRGEGARLGSDETGVNREAARLVVARFQAHERQRKVMWSAGAALSLAAAAALVVGLSRQGAGEKPVAQLAAASAQSPLVIDSGSGLRDGKLVARGEVVAANVPVDLAPRTCLRAGSSVKLCSPEGARVKLPALGKAWEVELLAGGVTAELEPTSSGFSVFTLHGSVSVVGTLFRVELDRTLSFTMVTVERGAVWVKHASGAAGSVEPGERAVLGEGLELSGGKHELRLDPLVPMAQEPAPSAVAGRDSGHAPAVSPKGKTAADLLEEARQQRGSRHYAQAAQLYRKLVQQHPESAEARAALVSLGQLELGQLGQPEAALRSFQQYLAHPGQLRQEAEHGMIQALQRLGRKAEERRAIEAFLARYPKSTQAGPLAERLKQL